MKKVLFAASIICSVLLSCESTRTNTSTKNDVSGTVTKLEGSWELSYIAGNDIAVLYPSKKPFIHFDIAKEMINGNSGCNNFTGKLYAEDQKIDFTKPMAMTRMACMGEGENIFIQALQKVSSYHISNDNTLNLLSATDSIVMRLSKK